MTVEHDHSAAYMLSFTAASLRPELARVVAEAFIACRDWAQAKQNVLASNALQARSPASAIRMEREFRQRLQTLTEPQLELLAQAPLDSRNAMAWLSVLKHSAFVFEFATEVLRDKLAAHDPVLRHSDYESYFESRILFHPELARLTTSSRNKIRQVLLRMLAEVGLLATGEALGTIQRAVLSPAVLRVVTSDNPTWLAGFLVPNDEIRNCRKP